MNTCTIITLYIFTVRTRDICENCYTSKHVV